jgi:hypothetical protein
VITHPVVCRIARSITKASTDERGILLARSGLVVPVRVSRPVLPRGLRILDALFTAADEAGYTLDWPKAYNTQVKILALEERTVTLIDGSSKPKRAQANQRRNRTPEERVLVAPTTMGPSAEWSPTIYPRIV